MPMRRAELAIDLMTDGGLWRQLERDFNDLERYYDTRTPTRPALVLVREMAAICRELKKRGVQLTLSIE